jgi:hypothetical protein
MHAMVQYAEIGQLCSILSNVCDPKNNSNNRAKLRPALYRVSHNTWDYKNALGRSGFDFIYVVILPNFWQALAQTTDHLQKCAKKWSFSSKPFFKLTLRFDRFFLQLIPCFMYTNTGKNSLVCLVNIFISWLKNNNKNSNMANKEKITILKWTKGS